MTKQTKPTRLIKLMDQIGWKNVFNWSHLQSQYVQSEILPFKAWVKRHTRYIRTDKARQAVWDYFVEGTNGDVGDGFYINKDRGVEALLALYAKEQESGK